MDVALESSLTFGNPTVHDTNGLWARLCRQITPSNSIITIHGNEYDTFSDDTVQWLANQYSGIVLRPVMFVRDCVVDRVFLGPEHVFRGLIIATADSIPVLMDPAKLVEVADEIINGAAIAGSTLPTATTGAVAVTKKEKVPRPANAFILYRMDNHEIVKAKNPGIHNNNISKIIGAKWAVETAAVVAKYRAKADQLKQEHGEKHPGYQYQPRKPSEKKRRMTKGKRSASAAAAAAAAINAAANVGTKESLLAQRAFSTPDDSQYETYGGGFNGFNVLKGVYDEPRSALLPLGPAGFGAIARSNAQSMGIDVDGVTFCPHDYSYSRKAEKAVPWVAIDAAHAEFIDPGVLYSSH